VYSLQEYIKNKRTILLSRPVSKLNGTSLFSQ